MANGIYVATSGTVARIQELEVLAHNLAHAKAPGFKRNAVTFESVAHDRRGKAAIDGDKEFVQTREPMARLDEGPLTRTDNPLDVAISGDAFLKVRTPQGDRLTRNGRMMVGRDGALRTLAGWAVLGQDGNELHLPPDRVPVIDQDGLVRAGDFEVGRIAMQRVDLSGTLERDEAGLFRVPADGPTGPPERASVLQGYIEGANVSAVEAMIELVEVQRGYEALHQVIRTYKEMDEVAARLPR